MILKQKKKNFFFRLLDFLPLENLNFLGKYLKKYTPKFGVFWCILEVKTAWRPKKKKIENLDFFHKNGWKKKISTFMFVTNLDCFFPQRIFFKYVFNPSKITNFVFRGGHQNPLSNRWIIAVGQNFAKKKKKKKKN